MLTLEAQGAGLETLDHAFVLALGFGERPLDARDERPELSSFLVVDAAVGLRSFDRLFELAEQPEDVIVHQQRRYRARPAGVGGELQGKSAAEPRPAGTRERTTPTSPPTYRTGASRTEPAVSPRTWRCLAVGGIAGPAAFVGLWAVLGAAQSGYSPIRDPISRLAAVGAPTRAPMTAGLLAFGAGVGAYAMALRSARPGGAALTAAGTAAASLGLAALPLHGSGGDRPHDVAAALAYVTLAATPILASRSLSAQGRRLAAWLSTVAGVTSGAFLLGSAVSPRANGLLQRVGLTVGHVWIAASAASMLRRALEPEREGPLTGPGSAGRSPG